MAIICDRCKKTNTEFSKFKMSVDISSAKNRMKFSGSSWIKRVVVRYVNALLNTKIDVDVNICQTCQSRMFRKLDESK